MTRSALGPGDRIAHFTIDSAIRWEQIDARSVRAHYTVGSNTISAVLSFNEAGELNVAPLIDLVAHIAELLDVLRGAIGGHGARMPAPMARMRAANHSCGPMSAANSGPASNA